MNNSSSSLQTLLSLTLFAALILSPSSCLRWSTDGNTLYDLESTNFDAFTAEVADGWTDSENKISGLVSYPCWGVPVLGGYMILSANSGSWFQRIYSGLPNHNQANINFTFYPVDTWDGFTGGNTDHFSFTIDGGTEIQGWYPDQNTSPYGAINNCGYSGYGDSPPINVYTTAIHNASNLTLRIISLLNSATSDESSAFRRIIINFANVVTPTNYVCGVMTKYILPDNRNCECGNTNEFCCYNNADSSCSCNGQNLKSTNDICCLAGTYYNDTVYECVCDDPKMLLDSQGNCCPLYQHFNSSTLACACDDTTKVPTSTYTCCYPGMVVDDQGQCTCPGNYHTADGIHCCPDGQNYDTATSKCVCDIPGYVVSSIIYCCPNGQHFDNDANPPACVCDDFGYLVSETLYCCLPDQHYSLTESKCVCSDSTYQLSYGHCCLPGQHYDIATAKTCVCNQKGYYVSNGHCCRKGMFYSNDTSSCVCPTGYELSNDYCCPPGRVYNATSRWCECPSGGVVSNGRCCPKGQIYSNASSGCICETYGYQLSNGFCCPTNTTYDFSSSTCMCNTPGYILSNGHCCPSDQVYSLYKSTCLCANKKHYITNGHCCAVGESYVDGNCKVNDDL